MDDATSKWLGGGKRYFVRRGDDAYPELLAEIGNPPFPQREHGR